MKFRGYLYVALATTTLNIILNALTWGEKFETHVSSLFQKEGRQ